MAFDQAAAEASIRRAYRASALAEPEQILWARGPREAAEALRFLRQPPRRQRRLGLALLAGGAVLWPSLALLVDNAESPKDPVNAATLIGAISAYYLARLSAQRPPLLPLRPEGTWNSVGAVVLGVAVFAAMVGVLLAVQNLGLPSDPLARGAALAVTLVSGMLPGVLLLLRLPHVLGNLPASVRNLAPAKSVARSMLRSRERARASPPNSGSAALVDHSLLRAYRSAYEEAWVRPGDFPINWASAGPIRQANFADEAVWVMAGFMRRIDPVLAAPAYLDGVEDAEFALAAEQEGTGGSGAFEDLAYHIDRLFPFRNVGLAVRPPTTMALDADDRPHAEGGPALAWADGTRVYAWRGRLTDEDLVDKRTRLTLSRISNETDPDRRRILIERYGLGRFLAESRAAPIQTDECGTLYRLEQPGEPLMAVRVVNSTPEPDGSFRDFWLRVPPTMRTARQAIAWTFGLSAEEYDPAAQS